MRSLGAAGFFLAAFFLADFSVGFFLGAFFAARLVEVLAPPDFCADDLRAVLAADRFFAGLRAVCFLPRFFVVFAAADLRLTFLAGLRFAAFFAGEAVLRFAAFFAPLALLDRFAAFLD